MSIPDRHGYYAGPSRLKAGLYTLLGTCAVGVFIATWPASVCFSLALLVWWLSRKGSSSFAENLEEASLAVLIGTGVFCTITLAVLLWPQTSAEAFGAEQWLLEARRDIHAVSGPDFTVYLLIFALLLASLHFFPRSGAIGKFLRAKKQFARIHLCLLAFTSFTLFGSYRGDRLAGQEHEQLVERLRMSLRKELDPARRLLKVKAAEKALRDALKSPIPEPARSRMIYLLKTVRGPAYKEVPVRHEKEPNLSPVGRLAWRVQYGDSWTKYKHTPIKGSFLRKAFIQELSREALKKVTQDKSSAAEASEANAADEAAIESLARKLLGGVAESQDEWRRQEDLVKEEPERSERVEERYKEVSKGLTEAMTTVFSEALGTLGPEVKGLAKEWMNEVIDTALISWFEKRLEGRTEAILNWYRENLTLDRIQDVPEELAREISPPPAAVSEILVPEFLTKVPGLTNGPPTKAAPLVSKSATSTREAVPEEVTRAIFWRTEEAEVELGGGVEQQTKEAQKQLQEGLQRGLEEEWDKEFGGGLGGGLQLPAKEPLDSGSDWDVLWGGRLTPEEVRRMDEEVEHRSRLEEPKLKERP